MADLPEIVHKIRLPLQIPIHPYLADHRFEGKAVLPAVEAMQLLVKSALAYLPDIDTGCIINAQFHRFLYINPADTHIDAFNEIEIHENGSVDSKLITVSKPGKTSIIRTKEHVSLTLSHHASRITHHLPLDISSALEGICFEVSSTQLYQECVPFGPSYQNVKNMLYISETGALAAIDSSVWEAPVEPLGSPFPLDAAFHAACAWGQRFSGIIAFPVGFEKRFILHPTQTGKTYIGRIVPVSYRWEKEILVFDIWIYDNNGILYEAVLGVQMKDVSAGKIRPPQWILMDNKTDNLKFLNSACKAVSVIELKTVQKSAEHTLSNPEFERFTKMRGRRISSYLAARLACKRLSRRLSGNDLITPPQSITTSSSDQIRPRCPLTDKSNPYFCSVSHDSRFAVAVASENKVGVDVEEISDRVVKCQNYFMSETEQDMARHSALGQMAACARIWTIKEAVSKALDILLPDCWKMVQINHIGFNESVVTIDDQDIKIFHDTVDDHLFSVVNIP